MAEQTRSTVKATGDLPGRPHFAGFESLRALAAVMVVVHHAASLAGPSRAGRLAAPAAVMDGGVAVFFVLSGFLIYRPFAAAHIGGVGGPRCWAFWWRRVLRIVPAYWLALTVLWWLGAFSLGRDWWRFYLFLQIYDRYTVLGGIVQAWSLCTEISFYLVIPLWAGAVAKSTARFTANGRATAQLVGCAFLGLGGVVSRAAFDRWAPASRGLAFNWLPTNLDLFAAGMAVAVISVWAASHAGLRARLDWLAQPVWVWWSAATALLAWYAYAVGPADFATGYSGWFWQRRQLVLATFTILLIVPAVFGDQAAGPLRRLWSWRPIVWVGTVSYGLYLWHLDWMELALSGPQGWRWLSGTPGDVKFVAVLGVGLGLGLVCAGISWYGVEQPLQRFKNLVAPAQRRSSARALGHSELPG